MCPDLTMLWLGARGRNLRNIGKVRFSHSSLLHALLVLSPLVPLHAPKCENNSAVKLKTQKLRKESTTAQLCPIAVQVEREGAGTAVGPDIAWPPDSRAVRCSRALHDLL
jgi:hypothetical protein